MLSNSELSAFSESSHDNDIVVVYNQHMPYGIAIS